MSFQIHIESDCGHDDLLPVLQRSAGAVLTLLHPEAGETTILLTGAEHIQELNKRYADHDYPTDVLSFTDGTIDAGTEMTYLGDVVIAVDVAAAQALQAGHSLQAEVALLTVHGMLHLLGFDHATKADKNIMWTHQAAILQSLGFSDMVPEETP